MNLIGRNTLCNNATSRDDCAIGDRHARANHRSGSNPGAVFNGYGLNQKAEAGI